jgi:hypothetical protein
MSRDDWERGTIVLPAAAVTAVKKAVRDEHNACVKDIHAECKRFWTDVAKRTRSQGTYRRALDEFISAPARHVQPHRRAFVLDEAHTVLSQLLHAGSLRQVTAKDLAACGLTPATTRTNEYRIGEARITFDGRNVTYSSGLNNHQVEHARGYPTVRALMTALDRVRWTRGTGGALVGNDENNQSYTDPGSGGNYITAAYGPLGDSERARAMGISVRAYRQRYSRPAARPVRRY